MGNISFPGQRRYRGFCLFPRGPNMGDPEPLCFWAPMVVMMKAKLDQLVIRELQSSHPPPYRKEKKRKKTEGRKEKSPSLAYRLDYDFLHIPRKWWWWSEDEKELSLPHHHGIKEGDSAQARRGRRPDSCGCTRAAGEKDHPREVIFEQGLSWQISYRYQYLSLPLLSKR